MDRITVIQTSLSSEVESALTEHKRHRRQAGMREPIVAKGLKPTRHSIGDSVAQTLRDRLFAGETWV